MKVIKQRKAQKPFINKEIEIAQIRKEYEKFKLRMAKERLSKANKR